eukprot:Opistho-2@31991
MPKGRKRTAAEASDSGEASPPKKRMPKGRKRTAAEASDSSEASPPKKRMPKGRKRTAAEASDSSEASPPKKRPRGAHVAPQGQDAATALNPTSVVADLLGQFEKRMKEEREREKKEREQREKKERERQKQEFALILKTVQETVAAGNRSEVSLSKISGPGCVTLMEAAGVKEVAQHADLDISNAVVSLF